MLKTRYLELTITEYEKGYFLAVYDDRDVPLEVSRWQNLLFSRHKESYYGTMIDVKRLGLDGNGVSSEVEGVVLDGWQLVTLFAHESFNRMVDWDWDEMSEICHAASPAVMEAISEKDWFPDFEAWKEDVFRWKLPERVLDEFGEYFWDQPVGETTAKSFLESWFNKALDVYVRKDSVESGKFVEKLEALRQSQVSPDELAAFFDEETWQEWIGVRENPLPFTIGLHLDEPMTADGLWKLDIFLRSVDDPDIAVELSAMPDEWEKYEDQVYAKVDRWVRLVPWLSDGGVVRNDDSAVSAGILRDELTEEEAWLFLTEASETLLALGVEILLPSWWEAMKKAELTVKAKVKGNASHRPSFVGLSALLDYDWRFSMNGVDLSEDEFNRLVEEKRRLVYVRGRWIKLDPAFIHRIQDLMKKAEKEGLSVRDLLEQELMGDADEEDELDNPKAFAKIQIELNRHWKQMMEQLSETSTIPEEPVPAGLNGELRPYQRLGMSWMLFLRRFRFGACLADDMGLGKTVQLISYLLSVKDREPGCGPSLIICPTSVLGNWQKELEKFAPSLRVHLHYGPGRLKGEAFAEAVRSADVVLTSYGLTHLDLEDFEPVEWSAIAIDEAQNIKNSQTKQSRAVRKLKGLHHIALTGTPMENRLAELWSIFDFTNHGYLGSAGQFQKKFVLPIEKEDKVEKVKELHSLIRPFLLRRTKKDEEVALNLPDKLEQKEYCPLTAEQASLYEQLVHDTLTGLEKLSSFERKGIILQMLSKLKQLCDHPSLYLKEQKPKDLVGRSYKMEKLVELAGSVIEQEESLIIFTQYIEMGEMIRKVLKKQFGIEVPFLNGSVAKAKRDEMIAKFQDREFPVFLLSLKAGGTGLNLTAANHVIHYDRWWNPAVENQATDRAYRIGQSRFVHVHKLICTGTLEEKIDAMLEKKQALNDQIIQTDSWITELSTDDLRELVRLG